MGTKQAFKTYQRGQRVQDTNVSFANGMYFTNSPLTEGFSRLLVNYDFGENGSTLKPRRGLCTTNDGLFGPEPANLIYQAPNIFASNDGISIVAGNQVVLNDKTYYQIIVGRITEYDNATERYLGDAWVLTCTRSQNLDKTEISVIRSAQLNDTSLHQKCMFVKPGQNSTTVHGIKVEDSEYIKRIVGSFAYNNDFYYFCTDQNLHYTKFNPEKEMFEPQTVTAYKPLQAETQNNLYNMLLEEPYYFENGLSDGALQLTGFMACEEYKSLGSNEIKYKTKLNPQTGIAYTYRLFYNYPESASNVKFCFHIEYNPGNNDTWYSIPRDETASQVVGKEPFNFSGIRVNSPRAQFRIYAIEESKASFTESNQLTLDSLANSVVLTASFNYAGSSETDSTANLDLVRYNLSYASGMVYWKNRLWLFGAKDRETGVQDDTILFSSMTNRPDWFPYTAYADIFDEEIIYLQPMLDDLLVFTNHNLYSLTLDSDGLSWTRKHLQSNLNLTKWDLNFIQIVKNMVFFKSGNYFYMVVPKLTAASGSGSGLAIAPVSKNITYLLDNFESNLKIIIDDLYNYSCVNRFGNRSKVTFDYKLVHYYNFLDYEDVHNCYIFEITKKEKVKYSIENAAYTTKDTKVYLNVELLYNTVSRTWRIYMLESQRIRQALFMNATGRGKYAELVNYKGYVGVQLLQYSDTLVQDNYIKQKASEPKPTEPLVFENWQYLDTGNLDQNTDMKKRFREYQFKINNHYSKGLQFYSGFMLDRGTRTYEMLYSYTEIEDEDENVATLVIDAQPKAGMQGTPIVYNEGEIQDSTKFEYTKLGSWMLGTSKFPETLFWKIRIPTSGKGYLPRLILISYNNAEYELVSCATVYRQLYSR